MFVILCIFLFCEVFGRTLPEAEKDLRSIDDAVQGKIRHCEIDDSEIWDNVSNKRSKSNTKVDNNDWFMDCNEEHIIIIKGEDKNRKMIDVNCYRKAQNK